MSSFENIIVDIQESVLFIPVNVDEQPRAPSPQFDGAKALKSFFFLTAICPLTKTIIEWDIRFDKRPSKQDIDEFRLQTVKSLEG